jgi:hypothetical protein
MADCECLPRCLFFNDKMAPMPALTDSYKKNYCHRDFASCARYMIFKARGREAVPGDLFPSQTDRAKALLATEPPKA